MRRLYRSKVRPMFEGNASYYNSIRVLPTLKKRLLLYAFGAVLVFLLIFMWWQRISGVYYFWVITGVHPGEGQCLYKRGIVDNFITPKECEHIIAIGSKTLIKQKVGSELRGANLYDILETFPDARDVSLLNTTRNRLVYLVNNYFSGRNHLYPEYTHITSRGAANDEYSHGVHVDSCGAQEDGSCVIAPMYCCAWRSHTLIMYLNDEGVDFEGGEFLFAPALKGNAQDCSTNFIIKPKCGRVVMFTSGPENPHAVKRVLAGSRWAFALWLTTEPMRREKALT